MQHHLHDDQIEFAVFKRQTGGVGFEEPERLTRTVAVSRCLYLLGVDVDTSDAHAVAFAKIEGDEPSAAPDLEHGPRSLGSCLVEHTLHQRELLRVTQPVDHQSLDSAHL